MIVIEIAFFSEHPELLANSPSEESDLLAVAQLAKKEG